jgi:hypothetical protein
MQAIVKNITKAQQRTVNMNLNSLLAFLFSLECEIFRYYIFSLHSQMKEVHCTQNYKFFEQNTKY